MAMGEVEFFDKVKKVNRFLSNEARDQIWEFIINALLDNYNTFST